MDVPFSLFRGTSVPRRVRCLRFASVGAGRGHLDLVRPVSRFFYFNGNPCFSRISVIFVHLKKWGHLRSFWGQLVFCFGKRTQGIYLCTACHFCDSITVSRFESSDKIDLGWMWGEFRSESRWLYLECTCTIVDFYNMHGYNICQQRIVRFLTTKIKLLQIVKYNWAG